MFLLEQSSTPTVLIGPFLDDGDGNTVEDSLTITQADVRLSKNAGNMAQKNDATSCTHDELGWYTCPLNATDTGTLGRLKLMVHESGALSVWHEFMVVPSNVYDSLVGGTDYLDTEVAAMAAGTVTATAVATGAIDADAIADNAIDAGAIAVNAIGASEIADGAIDAATFASGAINATAIATDAIAANEIAAAGANKIADHVIRRNLTNVESSSDGDTKTFRSPFGAFRKMVNRIYPSGANLLITEEDDATTFGTQVMTTDSGADPITELDTT